MDTFRHLGACKEAQRLIQQALDTGATHLDLSHLRLRKLPEDLKLLARQLVSLNLSGCDSLIDIELISSLYQLTHVDVSGCYSLSSLTGIESLKVLTHLDASGCYALYSLSELESLKTLTHLDLNACDVLTDFKSISQLTKLTELNISGSEYLTSLEGIENLTELTSLDISWHEKACCLSDIRHLSNLERLNVASDFPSEFKYFRFLSNLSKLHLTVDNWDVIKNDLDDLSNLAELEIGFYAFVPSLDGIKHFKSLKRLAIYGHSGIENLLDFKELKDLEQLRLLGCDNLRNLEGIESLVHLTDLDIQGCESLTTLVGIEHIKHLEKLNISECECLPTLHDLENLTVLKELNISHLNTLKSVDSLERLTQLKQLIAYNCSALAKNINSLAKLTQLEVLRLSKVDSITSLSFVKYLTNLKELDLIACKSLSSATGVENLKHLQILNLQDCIKLNCLDSVKYLDNLTNLELTNCKELESIKSLKNLENLVQLRVDGCIRLNSLNELGSLTGLTRLWLGDNLRLCDLSVISSLKQLKRLHMQGKLPLIQLESFKELMLNAPRISASSAADGLVVEHVPPEITQYFDLVAFEDWWFECEQKGVETPKSLKIMLLGNGRIGKTQLARRLRQETFDETVPSTHGIQLHKFNLPGSDVELKSWDFGGQDVYLGTHTLFIDQRAVYLLLWHPDFENNEQVACEQLEMRNRPLSYWLAYLKSLAGDNANVLVCQSQCDSPECDRPAPIPHPPPFPTLRPLTISTKMEDGLAVFLPSFKRAVNQQLERNGEVWLPKSWLAVEHEIYSLSKDRKQIAFEEFEDICFEYGVAAPMTLANFLHQSGVLFYRSGHFDDHLILDQQWALQGVYLLLDRQQVLPQLKAGKGRFTLEMLKKWIVQHHLDSDDSNLFLEMMQQCGACFKVDETHYIAPDNLEELDVNDAQQVWQYAEADSELELQYSFLHDATMRFLLSKIGEVAKAHAYYWRYGCCFYDSKHQVKVWFQCEVGVLEDGSLSNFSQPGKIIIRLAGSQSSKLARHLLESITKTHHLGQLPEVSWLRGKPLEFRNEQQERKQAEPFSEIGPATKPPVKQPTIYFSYAWGKEEEARQQASDQLYAKLKAEKFNVFRDKNSTELGSSIAEFERQIGAGDFALVILSKKYLYESAHCMKELAFLYEYSQRQQNDFTRRVIPVVLSDINIDSPIERLKIVSHWQEKMSELLALIDKVGSEAAGASSVDELQLMRAFINCIVNALTWLSDLVTERQQDLQVDATLELVKRRVEEYVLA